MPAVEALRERFRAAHTQVLGVSVDSIFCHANWAESLGGISYPLLADFHPKGKVADSYGLYLADSGRDDRATVIIDAGGIVRHISSVTPSGERDIADLAALCEEVDAAYEGDLPDFPAPYGLGGEATLYVKSSCGFSRAALLARANLHLTDAVKVRNVTEEPEARAYVKELTGKEQFPCLVTGEQAMFESAEIIRHLVAAVTDLPA